MTGCEARSVVAALLGWYARKARDLPWRRSRNPYAVWVSEVMLQQTQVKTVIPYWKRWMRELPTVVALAKARPEKVLKLWEGLGYYHRARNMQKAARNILRHHQGKFPGDKPALLALPGIGRYTAGAICSIAYNQPEPVVDGNVARVLCRLFGVRGIPQETGTSRRLWRLAGQLVRMADGLEPARAPVSPARSAGACSQFNQAMMELGAVVCLPRHPTCRLCPIRPWCKAWATGRVDALPKLRPRPPARPRRFLTFVLEYQGRFLVRRRGEKGVNAGLWEFPNIEVTDHDLTPARRFLGLFGLNVEQLEPLITFRHSITRFRIHLEASHSRVVRPPSLQPASGKWLLLRELDSLPFTSAHRKVLRHLRDHA